MRSIIFAKRNFKEIIRDPLSIIFAIILPMFLLFIFQQFNIPNEMFELEYFTPSIVIFSFSFISLFTATLVAKDRSTSLLVRLSASPMKTIEYILGYILSVIPFVLIQNILFFTLAIILGLNFNINIIYTALISLPISVLFIALGVLIGSFTSEKASSGVGSVIVQLVAFTSGMYFSSDMAGKFFSVICKILPFESSVNIVRSVLNGNENGLLKSIIIVFIYTIITLIVSIFIFKKNMISDNK